MFVQILFLFENSVVYLFIIEFKRFFFLCVFWRPVLIRYMACRYFLSLSFSLYWWCPLKHRSFFHFDEISFICLYCVAVLLLSYLRNCCLIWGHGDLLLCFLLRVFVVLGLRFRSFIGFDLGMAWDRHPGLYLCVWICSFASNSCWRGTSFSCCLCWKSVNVNIRVYFWIWNSSPLIYMSVFTSVPLCTAHCLVTLW